MKSPQPAIAARAGWLTCCLVWTLAFRAVAQQYAFTNYTELNGLPSSEAYQVYQDKEGFVWIATDNGVVRTDGGNFEVFNRTTGLTDNTVFGVYEDASNRIWFRTYSGALSYYSKGLIYTYQYNSALQEKLQKSLLNKIVVGKNRLWFASNGYGAAGSVDSIGHVTILEESIDPYAEAWIYVYIVENGEHLTGFNGTPRLTKSVRIAGEEYPIEVDPIFHTSPVAQSLALDGSIYISVNKDLFRYRDKRVVKVASFDHAVINLSIDRSQAIWVGLFGGGVRRFENQNFDTWTTIPALSDRSVSSTLHDSEGGYWFSTLDKGVFYFPNLEIQTGDIGDGNKISTVGESNNRLYFGDYSGKVTVTDTAFGNTEVLLQEPTAISALFVDNGGNIWGASATEYFKLSPDRKLVFRHSSRQTIRGFFTDTNGSVYVYSSSAVHAIDERGRLVNQIDMSRRPLRIFYTDSIVYMGSLYGLERLNTRFEQLDRSTYLIDGRISVIKSLGPHRLLVGTIGRGAFIVDHGVVAPVISGDGVGGENIYDILVLNNQVWLATDGGMLMANANDIASPACRWRRLTRSSGLISDKCNRVVRAGKRVLVVSDQGYSLFPINIGTYLNDKPRAYIRMMLVNNEEVQPDELDLHASRNNISIRTGVVSFNNRKLFLRHRLSKESNWIYHTDWDISYFSMIPGRYDMEIEASSDKTNWYGVNNALQFRINVPWWKTWLFQSLVVVVIGAAVYVGYRLRLNVVRRRQKYLEVINSHQQRLIDSEIRTQERERKRIATDLHDGVGTSLSSIKLMLSDSLNATEAERAKRIQAINDNLADVIEDIKRIIYDLHPPALERYGLQVGLKNLVQRLNSHGGIHVKFDYYGQRDVRPQTSIMVYRIIQELISNTIKHARASEIRIHINQFDNEMNIMYEDNGVGMVGSLFDGLGLMSIESRVRTLQGRMSWESNHKGTFYNFDIPF